MSPIGPAVAGALLSTLFLNGCELFAGIYGVHIGSYVVPMGAQEVSWLSLCAPFGGALRRSFQNYAVRFNNAMDYGIHGGSMQHTSNNRSPIVRACHETSGYP